MDLLGRKARRQLEATRTHLSLVAAAEAQAKAAAYELLSLLRSRDALISDLLAENEVLNEQTTALAEAAADMAGQLAAIPQASTEPFRVSEEEQEAEWQLKQGIIDTQEYEHLLKELDFQNANIELDPDYTPREVTY